MEQKRVENLKQRLHEKIVEGKEYLKKEVYNVNELVRCKTHLEKKKTQFEKDIEVYLKVSDKDENKIANYKCLKIESEVILDDLQLYIYVQKHEAKQKKIEREAEEKKMEAEKFREAEERERERQYNLEMERIKTEERMKNYNWKRRLLLKYFMWKN